MAHANPAEPTIFDLAEYRRGAGPAIRQRLQSARILSEPLTRSPSIAARAKDWLIADARSNCTRANHPVQESIRDALDVAEQRFLSTPPATLSDMIWKCLTLESYFRRTVSLADMITDVVEALIDYENGDGDFHEAVRLADRLPQMMRDLGFQDVSLAEALIVDLAQLAPKTQVSTREPTDDTPLTGAVGHDRIVSEGPTETGADEHLLAVCAKIRRLDAKLVSFEKADDYSEAEFERTHDELCNAWSEIIDVRPTTPAGMKEKLHVWHYCVLRENDTDQFNTVIQPEPIRAFLADTTALAARFAPGTTGDADAELLAAIREKQALDHLVVARGTDHTDEEISAERALVGRIESTPSTTLSGAVSKLQVYFTDQEMRACLDGGALERVAAKAVQELVALQAAGAVTSGTIGETNNNTA